MTKSFLNKIIILFVLSLFNLYPQSSTQLDSLYNLFLHIRGIETDIIPDGQEGIEAAHKCGMQLVNTLQSNIEYFSPEKQAILKILLSRPQLPNSIISPGGFFKIHYTTTGNDRIAYDLNLFAQALDSAYNYEVNYLGYPPPPADFGAGGDDRYDIYVTHISGLYGYTQFEEEIQSGTQRFTSYMVVDNDFPWYTAQGKQPIDAARVTVAHEFHHAIQGGNYIFRADDTFFYEITSTAMEEFVFDSVNDYYAYMNDYFQNPSRSFPNNDGYNLAIWNIFLKDRFDFDILKRQWELMPTNRALTSISKSIEERGSVFEFELTLFGLWSYFTNHRSVSGAYFEEAEFYPQITPTVIAGFTPPSQNFSISGFPAANYFLRTLNPANGDTIVAIFGNGDYQKALGTTISPLFANYTLNFDTISGDYKIGDFYSASFNTANNPFWKQAEIINNIPLTGDSIHIVKDISVEISPFPSPYRYNNPNRKSGESIRFPVDIETNKEVDVNIYTISMDLINSFTRFTKPHNLKDATSDIYKQISIIEWDKPVDQNGENLPSGIYIYAVKDGNYYKTGKFVIFND
ncbi:MAG: hypothetical protein R6W68_10345 [Ignavibacteriaceae bacterium]